VVVLKRDPHLPGGPVRKGCALLQSGEFHLLKPQIPARSSCHRLKGHEKNLTTRSGKSCLVSSDDQRPLGNQGTMERGNENLGELALSHRSSGPNATSLVVAHG
ncbi:MAG: hypothetical protein JSW15_08305, partial [Deltaproteobacteria bacterium]